MNNDLALQESLCNWALGLSGEVGEVIEHIKKHCFHGKDLNYDEVEKEIGDVLWYVSALCTQLGLNLDEVAQKNVDKLMARYPDGFEKKTNNEDAKQVRKVMKDIFRYDDEEKHFSSVAVFSHVGNNPTNKNNGENKNQNFVSGVVTPIRKLDVWQIPTEDD